MCTLELHFTYAYLWILMRLCWNIVDKIIQSQIYIYTEISTGLKLINDHFLKVKGIASAPADSAVCVPLALFKAKRLMGELQYCEVQCTHKHRCTDDLAHTITHQKRQRWRMKVISQWPFIFIDDFRHWAVNFFG